MPTSWTRNPSTWAPTPWAGGCAPTAGFATHHPRPLKATEAPDFNPVFYTLDLLLPVISFGQESAFAPSGGCQTLSYVLIVTGWIRATTVVAGVTRTVSRQ